MKSSPSLLLSSWWNTVVRLVMIISMTSTTTTITVSTTIVSCHGLSVSVVTKVPSISMPVWSLASPLLNGDTSMNICTFCTPVSVGSITTTGGLTNNNNNDNDTDDNTKKEKDDNDTTTTTTSTTTTTTSSDDANDTQRSKNHHHHYYSIALYKNTMTHDAMMRNSKFGVLQLLVPEMMALVPLLGQKSGYDKGYSKADACTAVGYSWIRGGNLNLHSSIMKMGGNYKNNYNNNGNEDDDEEHMLLEPGGISDDLSLEGELALLPDCALYVHLKFISSVDAGDHDVVLCQVLGVGQWNNDYGVVKCRPVHPDNNNSKNSLTSADGIGHLNPTNVLYTQQLKDEGIIQ